MSPATKRSIRIIAMMNGRLPLVGGGGVEVVIYNRGCSREPVGASTALLSRRGAATPAQGGVSIAPRLPVENLLMHHVVSPPGPTVCTKRNSRATGPFRLC